ncbi:DivIVA domain-containing protein [Propionicimonas sp.]|uniref:DivIVA domain-containing protein n=1 Tax=Propionicimonas sp. TaxID=1955623 RepID=UPI001DFABA81|nr:DivIVA domain-containing protein [Propionicimonas sp.]MBU3977448.1 DivIVA domain-containing protein [Actinomycetota bacterium]MBU3985958.1 DivIVA domain-containing protein [Actinomycetota bacterium]MBU4008743.1 DivIVA domain-containing protein [Actinomycetota bacterium]MBU4066107.1 DivIVA domain-containing protein [Actinomycetota bacterium]MBU4093555.1 DivIVA domain-containing protein [Actinomycetota bacterium]
MTYDDTTGLDLFDETATAVGNFPQSLRGYDKGAVDAYVRDVEAQLSRAKAQIRQQQKQLAAATAKADDTDFSKLGAHARGMLRSAEAQANELLTTAQAKAKELIAQAEIEAERKAEEVVSAAEETRAKSSDSFAELRKQLSEQNAADLSGVKDQAAMIREAAKSEAEQIIGEAQAQAKLIAEKNVTECEAKLAEADRHYAEQQVALAQQKEADLASLKLAQEEAAGKLESLVEGARERAEGFQAKIESDSQTWDQRREAVIAEAERIRQAAEAEADSIMVAARKEAKTVHSAAIRVAEDKKAKLESSVDLLAGRHKAILAQLNELSALAGKSVVEYGDPDKDALAPAEDLEAEVAEPATSESPTEAADGEETALLGKKSE